MENLSANEMIIVEYSINYSTLQYSRTEIYSDLKGKLHDKNLINLVLNLSLVLQNKAEKLPQIEKYYLICKQRKNEN